MGTVSQSRSTFAETLPSCFDVQGGHCNGQGAALARVSCRDNGAIYTFASRSEEPMGRNLGVE